MAYYKEHAHEGRDEASLAELRERCAALVSSKLGMEVGVDELVGGGAVSRLPGRRAGARRRSASGACGWWRSRTGTARCRRVLERCGLGGLLDGDRHLRRDRLAQAGPRDLRARRWSSPAASRRRRCTSGTPPRRTSRGRGRPGIRALLIDRDGRRRRHRLARGDRSASLRCLSPNTPGSGGGRSPRCSTTSSGSSSSSGSTPGIVDGALLASDTAAIVARDRLRLALVQLLRLLRVALGTDDRQERDGIEVRSAGPRRAAHLRPGEHPQPAAAGRLLRDRRG